MSNVHVHLFGGTTQTEASKIKFNDFSGNGITVEEKITLNLYAKKVKTFFNKKPHDDSLRDFLGIKDKTGSSMGFDISTLFTTGDSVVKGMTSLDSAKNRAEIMGDFVHSVEHDQQADIVFFAHSRGCGLSLLTAQRMFENGYENRLKRIILLDPVSKNQGQHEIAYTGAAEYLAKNGVEIFIYTASNPSKTKSTKQRKLESTYDSYVDHLIGTKRAYQGTDRVCAVHLLSNAEKNSGLVNYLTNEEKIEVDKNIHLITAETGHGGMFDNDYNSLKKLREIVRGEFHESCFGFENCLDINQLLDKEKSSLEQYISKNKSASEIKNKGTFLKKLKDQFGLSKDGIFKQLRSLSPNFYKDRFRAVVHKLALIKEGKST